MCIFDVKSEETGPWKQDCGYRPRKQDERSFVVQYFFKNRTKYLLFVIDSALFEMKAVWKTCIAVGNAVYYIERNEWR